MVNHYLFLFVLIRVYPSLSVAGSILERAVRLELTNTGFAIRRLSRLATRARISATDGHGFTQIGRTAFYSRLFSFSKIFIRVDPCKSVAIMFWNGRRDSNSRIEFGRLACF